MHLRFAEVEKAIGEAQIFRYLGFGKYRERERFRRAQDFGAGNAYFDFARYHGGIDGGFVARHHFAIHPDHGLLGQRRNQFVNLGLRLHHQLRDPVVIGKVDEINAPMVPAIPQPAGEPDVGSGVRASELAACVSPVPVHSESSIVE